MYLNRYLYREAPGIADTPAEMIAAATCMGGEHPCDRFVICGYRGGHLVAVMPLPMDAPVCDRVDRIWAATSHLARMGLTGCALVGYGTPMHGTAQRLISGLNAYGITVPAALYLTGGHCHSYLLDDWPAGGVPYPAAPTWGTSTAEGAEYEEDAEDDTGVLELGDHRLAAYRFLDLAVTRYADGGRLTDDEAEILALQLRDDRVRDEALTLIHHRGPLTAHRALWSDLARRVVQQPFTARAHILLGVTFWHEGDPARAAAEIGQALRDDPWDYVTVMLDRAITAGTMPHAILFALPGDLAKQAVRDPVPNHPD